MALDFGVLHLKGWHFQATHGFMQLFMYSLTVHTNKNKQMKVIIWKICYFLMPIIYKIRTKSFGSYLTTEIEVKDNDFRW